MANLTTVVALLALGAVAGKMSYRTILVCIAQKLQEKEHTVTAAGVAGLLALAAEATLGSAVARSTPSGALTSDVSDLTALVALGTTLTAVALTTLGRGVGVVAFPGKMAGLAASVAGLLLLGTGAFTA
jgi:hypothetical protein